MSSLIFNERVELFGFFLSQAEKYLHISFSHFHFLSLGKSVYLQAAHNHYTCQTAEHYADDENINSIILKLLSV